MEPGDPDSVDVDAYIAIAVDVVLPDVSDDDVHKILRNGRFGTDIDEQVIDMQISSPRLEGMIETEQTGIASFLDGGCDKGPLEPFENPENGVINIFPEDGEYIADLSGQSSCGEYSVSEESGTIGFAGGNFTLLEELLD